jgi:hypothetical protein
MDPFILQAHFAISWFVNVDIYKENAKYINIALAL